MDKGSQRTRVTVAAWPSPTSQPARRCVATQHRPSAGALGDPARPVTPYSSLRRYAPVLDGVPQPGPAEVLERDERTSRGHPLEVGLLDVRLFDLRLPATVLTLALLA